MAIKIYVDQGVNQKILNKLAERYREKVVFVHVDHYEQLIKCAEPVPGPFVLDCSLLDSSDYLVDLEISENIEKTLFPNGKNKRSDNFDVTHIYAAKVASCDYFVTNNPKDFMKNGKKEQLEMIIPGLKIVEIDELVIALKKISGEKWRR